MTIHDEVILALGVAALAWVCRSFVGWVLVVILGAVAAQNVANAIYRNRRE